MEETPETTNGNAEVQERRDAFVGELFEKIIGAMEVATVYLGGRLGLYRALADAGPATPAELAERTGTNERYAREWLEQQAVTGILEVEDAGADGSARRYGLPAGHAKVLLDRDSLNYLAPVARFTMGLMRPLSDLAEAFRTGKGLPYPDYGEDAREGQADANRPMFVNLLGSEWLPSSPTCTSGCWPTRPRAWPTSGAARAGRASRSPGHTPMFGWTATPRTSYP
jgi:winged helix-turn-helix protein